MGDIADGMINGDFDFYTGEYIGNGGGYPRTHNKSLPWERGNKKKKKVSSNEYGIMNLLCVRRGYSKDDAYLTIRWYAPEIGIESQDIEIICTEIQKDFPKFVQYLSRKTQK